MFKKIILFTLLLSSFVSAQDINIHISTSGNDSTGDGSINSPFATWSKAWTEANTNDTILFKRGDSWNFNIGKIIDKSGITIGAYGTGPNPILDDQKKLTPYSCSPKPCGGFTPFFKITAPNVTIENLDLLNSSGEGIRIEGINADDATIRNLNINWTWRHGIRALNGADRVTIDNNTIKYDNNAWKLDSEEHDWGQAIAIGRNSSSQPVSNNITVTNNTIGPGYGEGIGAIGGTNNVLIDNNVVKSQRAVGIYCDGCNTTKITNNLVAGSSDLTYQRTQGYNGNGLYVTAESWQNYNQGNIKVFDVEVSNNVVSGMYSGFTVGRGVNSNDLFNDLVVVHNTFVDNLNTFQRSSLANLAGTGVRIANNITINTVAGTNNLGTNNFIDPDWNFTSNYWSQGHPGIEGHSGDLYNGTTLNRTSNWRDPSVVASLTKTDFMPIANSSIQGAATVVPEFPAQSDMGASLNIEEFIPTISLEFSLLGTPPNQTVRLSLSTDYPNVGSYYVVCDTDNTVPSKTQIIEGKDSDNNNAIKFGPIAVSGNSQTIDIGSLVDNAENFCFAIQQVQ